jgi:hypothetical protein
MDALSYDIGTEGANSNGFGRLANDIAPVMINTTIDMGCLYLFPGECLNGSWPAHCWHLGIADTMG